MRRRELLVGAGRVLLGGLAAACRPAGGPRTLDGSGATLPYPLYARWSQEYARIDPHVRINYQPVGSAAGIRQMTDEVTDFGATDEPLSDAELAALARPFVHVPTTIGAVVLAYNLAAVPELMLTPKIVADVFLGSVTRWDDDRIRESNPHAQLPAEPIAVVHRADGSGTSAALTTLLAARSEAFRERIGRGTIPRFSVGVGARGNDGVTALVKATPNAIGYVELSYARAAALPAARIQNRHARFVAPTLTAVERAAQSAVSRARDVSRVSVVDADHEDAYPLAASSFVLVPRHVRERAKGEALARFLWWAVHDGQRFARDAGYVPLPPALVAAAEVSLRSLRQGGRPLVEGAS